MNDEQVKQLAELKRSFDNIGWMKRENLLWLFDYAQQLQNEVQELRNINKKSQSND